MTMGQSLMDRIHAKLELFRLEKRYTRRRHRRSTFVSNAVYVDGEYVYQTPNSTGSSSDSSTGGTDALHGERAVGATAAAKRSQMTAATTMTAEAVIPERKRLSRFNSMPGFDSSFDKDEPEMLQRHTSLVR